MLPQIGENTNALQLLNKQIMVYVYNAMLVS